MITKIVKDGWGQDYEAYIGYTKSGIEVHLDKALADLAGNPEQMLLAEIIAHEKAETA